MANTLSNGDKAVLASGLRIRGRVRGDGDLRIQGQIQGDVSVSGALELGEGARIQGAVAARTVTIAGEVDGDVAAQGTVAIGATGALRGDVTAGEFILEEGGRFHGTVQANFDLPKAIA